MATVPALRVERWTVPAERWVRNELVLVAGLIVLGTLLPMILGGASGALELPRNDDWSYRRTALELWQTGHLTFDTVAAPILIGQVLLVQPLLWLTHGSVSAFQIAGIVASLTSTLGVYWMARDLLTPARSFLATLSLVLFPGFLAYSTSFMTDGPALAAQVWAIAIGMRALRSNPTDLRRLAVAMTIAVIGFSVRQFAIAAVAALAIAALAREPGRRAIRVTALTALAACAAVYVIRSAMPGEMVILEPNVWFATRIPQAAVSVALLVLPAAIVALITNRATFQVRDLVPGALIGGALALSILAWWIRFDAFPNSLLGNLATQQGMLDVFDGRGRPYLFTDAFWTTISLLGVAALPIVGASITARISAHRRRHPGGISTVLRDLGTPTGALVAFVVVSVAGLAAYGTAWILFDRYLWPLTPALATLLLIPAALAPATEDPTETRWGALFRPAVLAPLTILTLQGVLTITLTANALAFDVARWRGGEDLVTAGLRPDAIDAGFEWVGAHATTPANLWTAIKTNPAYRGWWPAFRPCGIATGVPQAPEGTSLVGTERYRLYLVAGPLVDIYLYRSSDPACGATPG
jgi:hypothetical protein